VTGPTVILSESSSLISPAELVMIWLNENMDRDIVPAGAVVGGADDEQQQFGCVALMDAGDAKQELYVPLLWKRIQIRCMGPGLAEVDRIGNHVDALLHGRERMVCADAAGREWLVHSIFVASGPSHHIDSTETWESLLIGTICVGREPVRVPGAGS
jgi:hypothetical protein